MILLYVYTLGNSSKLHNLVLSDTFIMILWIEQLKICFQQF